jgi:hypothetical protein
VARDLVVSFLCSVPPSVLALFQERPLSIVCPVSQWGECGAPGSVEGKCTPPRPGQTPLSGGRAGYRQWLSGFAVAGAVIPGLARAAGLKTGEKLGRVCVMGFSNGCIGVDELLRYEDSAKIDLVICCDGVHGSWGPGKSVQPYQYKAHINHAAMVAQADPEDDRGAPVMVITHSSIVPGAYPSTTDTADVIWNEVLTVAPDDYLSLEAGYGCLPVLRTEEMILENAGVHHVCASDVPYCLDWYGLEDGWYDRRICNNLYVLGWGELGAGPAKVKDVATGGKLDHHHQARVVLPALLRQFCVKRWSPVCTLEPVAGLGQALCIPPEGTAYDDSDAKKTDYVPDLTAQTPPIEPCPYPGWGQVLTGGQGDRCSVTPNVPPGTLPGPRSAPSGGSLLAGVAGAAGGYLAVRYGGRLLRRLRSPR